MSESKTQSAGLRRAIAVTMVGTLLVVLRVWGLVGDAARPSSEAHQRLTPIDAPRFAGGRWVDEEGRPIGEGAR